MKGRGSAKVFLEKACKKCLEDYRKAYLLLESLDLMYEALDNTLTRALWNKFEGAKREALKHWGSIEVEEAFSNLKVELSSTNLRKYQKTKGDDEQ